MKGGTRKSCDTKLLFLSTADAWNRFNCHTIYIEDDTVKQRLDALITSIPDAHTAFGLEIRYHRSCWRTYVSDHKTLTEESAQHLQVIFEDHEFRTLQGLLKDYKRVVANYGHDPQVKSSYLKELLQKEFGESI